MFGLFGPTTFGVVLEIKQLVDRNRRFVSWKRKRVWVSDTISTQTDTVPTWPVLWNTLVL